MVKYFQLKKKKKKLRVIQKKKTKLLTHIKIYLKQSDKVCYIIESKYLWRIWITWWILISSDIQDNVEYIYYQIHETFTTFTVPIQIYVNKIENRITFKIKLGYFFKLSKSEVMKLLGSKEKR